MDFGKNSRSILPKSEMNMKGHFMKIFVMYVITWIIISSCQVVADNVNNVHNANNINTTNNLQNTNNINSINNNKINITNYDCSCATCKEQINIFEDYPARSPTTCFETYHSHATPPHSYNQTLDFGVGRGGIVEMGKEIDSTLRYYNFCGSAVYITSTWRDQYGYIPKENLPKDTPFRLIYEPSCGGTPTSDYYFGIRYSAKKKGTFTLTLRLHFVVGYTDVHLKAVTP